MSDSNLHNDAAKTAAGASSDKKTVTRRDVLAMAGCGVAGLVAGGALMKWGVVEDAVASGRIELSTTPHKFIVTDRARCSGCQRCELACSLRNDGHASQHTARVRVWPNYSWGPNVGSGDGEYGSCQWTLKTCKQCADPWCVNNCPVHAISADKETGARVVDPKVCIGCGMCHEACPWNMPMIDNETHVSTKCISCGRCAVQCPNGAIQFIDWKDIADEVLAKGIVSTTTVV